jgi:hypothetical protein
VFDPLPSDGALGLTPPTLSAVEVPPVERTLILTEVIVVTDGGVDPEAPGLVAAAGPRAASAAEECGGVTSGGGWAAARPLESMSDAAVCPTAEG